MVSADFVFLTENVNVAQTTTDQTAKEPGVLQPEGYLTVENAPTCPTFLKLSLQQ